MSQMKTTIFLLLMFLTIEVSSIVENGKQQQNQQRNQWNQSRLKAAKDGGQRKLIEEAKIQNSDVAGTTTEINGFRSNLKFEMIPIDWPNETTQYNNATILIEKGNIESSSNISRTRNDDDVDGGDILENENRNNNNNNNGTKNPWEKSDWPFVINWSNYSLEHGGKPTNVSNNGKRQPPIQQQQQQRQQNGAANINNKTKTTKKKKEIKNGGNVGQISADVAPTPPAPPLPPPPPPPFSINNNGIDSPTTTTTTKTTTTTMMMMMIKVNYTSKLDQNDNDEEQEEREQELEVRNNNDINIILNDGAKFNESEPSLASNNNNQNQNNQNKTKSGVDDGDGVRVVPNENPDIIELSSLLQSSPSHQTFIDETNQLGSKTKKLKLEPELELKDEAANKTTMANMVNMAQNSSWSSSFSNISKPNNDDDDDVHQINNDILDGNKIDHDLEHHYDDHDHDDGDVRDQIQQQQQSANVVTSEERLARLWAMLFHEYCSNNNKSGQSTAPSSSLIPSTDLHNLFYSTFPEMMMMKPIEYDQYKSSSSSSSLIKTGCSTALLQQQQQRRKQRRSTLDPLRVVVEAKNNGNEIQNNHEADDDNDRQRNTTRSKRIDSNLIRSNGTGNDDKQLNLNNNNDNDKHPNQNQNLEHTTTMVKNNDKNNLGTGTTTTTPTTTTTTTPSSVVPNGNNSSANSRRRLLNKWSGTPSSSSSSSAAAVAPRAQNDGAHVSGKNVAPNQNDARLNMFVQDLAATTATTTTMTTTTATTTETIQKSRKTIQNPMMIVPGAKTKTMMMMNQNNTNVNNQSLLHSDEIEKNVVHVVDSKNKSKLHPHPMMLVVADVTEEIAESNLGVESGSSITISGNGTHNSSTTTETRIVPWSAKIQEPNHTHHHGSGFWNKAQTVQNFKHFPIAPSRNDTSTGNATTTTPTTMVDSETNNDNNYNNGNSPNNDNNGNNINDDDWLPGAMVQSSSNIINNDIQPLHQQQQPEEVENRVNGGSFKENRSLETSSTTTTTTTTTTKTTTNPLGASEKENHHHHHHHANNNSEDVKYRIHHQDPETNHQSNDNNNTNNNNNNDDTAANNMTNLHYNFNQSKLLSSSSSLPSTTTTTTLVVTTEGNISRENVTTTNENENENTENDAAAIDANVDDARRRQQIEADLSSLGSANQIDGNVNGGGGGVLSAAYCPSQTDQQHDIIWPKTDAGILSIQPCPMKAYYGTMFRLCHGFNNNNEGGVTSASGAGPVSASASKAIWMQPDLTECRLTKLRELHYLVQQHSRKHLVDGLFLLVVELKNLLVQQTIHSPMDQVDSFALLNQILRHMIEHKIRFDRFDQQQQRSVVRFIQSVIIITDRLLERINHNVYRNNDPVISELLQLITSLRLLMDNVLRAFILACQDGSIQNLNRILRQQPNQPSNQQQPFFPATKNLGLHLRYQRRTEPKRLITLIRTNQTTVVDYRDTCRMISSDHHSFHLNHQNHSFGTTDDSDSDDSNLPSIISLQGVQEMDVGITEIRLRNPFQNSQPIQNRLVLISDHILSISLVPAVSIEVNFEQTPCFEVVFLFKPEAPPTYHHHQQHHHDSWRKTNIDKFKFKNRLAVKYNDDDNGNNQNESQPNGATSNNMIQCARMMISHRKQPVWMVDSGGCRTASFNGTHLRCWCQEPGLIAAARAAAAVSRSWSATTTDNDNDNVYAHNDDDDDDGGGIPQPPQSTMMAAAAAAAAVAYRHNMARIIRSSGFHLTPGTMAPSSHHILYDILLYTSLVASVLFYSVTLVVQYQLRHYETRETFFIIRNLIIALLLIQLTFLLGTTIHMDLFWIRVDQLSIVDVDGFPPTTTGGSTGTGYWSNQIKHALCLAVPIFLHFIHLASMFWMLSHTILLYQRMWRKYRKSKCQIQPRNYHDYDDHQKKMLQNRKHPANRKQHSTNNNNGDKMMLLNELGVHSHECRRNFLKKISKQPHPPSRAELNNNQQDPAGRTRTKTTTTYKHCCSSIFERFGRKLFKHNVTRNKSVTSTTSGKQQSNVSKIQMMEDGDDGRGKNVMTGSTTGRQDYRWFPPPHPLKLLIKSVRQSIDHCGRFLRSIFNTWNCAHYLCLSLGFPFIFVLVSYLLNPKGYETKRYCWMSIEGGIQYSFIMPVLLLISLNTCLILLVLKRYFKRKPLSNRGQIHQIRPSIRASIILLPFFCLNWFLGVLSLETLRTTPFELIFAVTNGLHSFMAFYFHCYQRYNLKHHLQQYGSVNVKIYKFSQKYSSTLYKWFWSTTTTMMMAGNALQRMFASDNENSQQSSNIVNNNSNDLDHHHEQQNDGPDEGQRNMFHANQYQHHHHHQHNRNGNGNDDDGGDNDQAEQQKAAAEAAEDDDNDNADHIDLDHHQIITNDDGDGDPTMVIIENSSNNGNNNGNDDDGDTVDVYSSLPPPTTLLSSNLMCYCNDLVYGGGGGGQCPYQCPYQCPPPHPDDAVQNDHSLGAIVGGGGLYRSSSFPNLNLDPDWHHHHHHPHPHHPHPHHFLLTSTATTDNMALGSHHHHHHDDHGQHGPPHHHHCFCGQPINDDDHGNGQKRPTTQPVSSKSSSSSSATSNDYYYSLNLGQTFQVIPEYQPAATTISGSGGGGGGGTLDHQPAKIDPFGTTVPGQLGQQQWLMDDPANNYDGDDNDHNGGGPKQRRQPPAGKMEPAMTLDFVVGDNINGGQGGQRRLHRRPKMMMDCCNDDNHHQPNHLLLERRGAQLSKIDFTLPSSPHTGSHLSNDDDDHDYNRSARIMLSSMDFEEEEVVDDEDEDLIIIEIEDDDDDEDDVDDEEEDTDEILESDYDHEMVITEDDKIIF